MATRAGVREEVSTSAGDGAPGKAPKLLRSTQAVSATASPKRNTALFRPSLPSTISTWRAGRANGLLPATTVAEMGLARPPT
jgi:hypothetical protein